MIESEHFCYIHDAVSRMKYKYNSKVEKKTEKYDSFGLRAEWNDSMETRSKAKIHHYWNLCHRQ
jgi:hypothetical protein